MEYLMMVGVAFMILVPMMYIFYDFTTSTRDEIALAKLDKIGNTIVNTAEEVFFLGPPSKSTIYYTMPQGVVHAEVRGPDILVFYYGGLYDSSSDSLMNSKQVIIPSNVPLEFDPSADLDSLLSSGRKSLVLTATPGTLTSFIKLSAKTT